MFLGFQRCLFRKREVVLDLSPFYLYCLQFVADGVFYAELNELLTRELAADGYSGVEVRVTPLRTEIIIKATRTQNVLGKLARYLFALCWFGRVTSNVVEQIRFELPSVQHW
jgi:hypothetical protein